MRLTQPAAVLALLSFSSYTSAASSEKPPKPCTVKSSTTNSFYDLSPLSLLPITEDKKADDKHREHSWTARGVDYVANFTLNICAPVLEDLDDVQGLSKKEERNVSAYYTNKGRTFSIGSVSTMPVLRDRKLVLKYTGGSPCPAPRKTKRDHDSSLLPRKLVGGGDDDDDDEDRGRDRGGHDDDREDRPSRDRDSTRRRSTIISFLCARDPAAPKAAVSYVDTADDCTYVFDVRTPYACEGASSDIGEQGGVGPAGVFGLIVLITVAAYIVGGVAYQRTVMHQRGWRQLPNYGAWASLWTFITDCFVIAFSSCSRLIPRRGGYNQLPTYTNRAGLARNEDENRLIDQLDEQWDD